MECSALMPLYVKHWLNEFYCNWSLHILVNQVRMINEAGRSHTSGSPVQLKRIIHRITNTHFSYDCLGGHHCDGRKKFIEKSFDCSPPRKSLVKGERFVRF